MSASTRPTGVRSIRLLVGLHLLEEWDDLTDEQVLDQLEFNLQWHYALAVEPGTAHVCQKTLHDFRVKLMESERAQQMFELVTRGLVEMDELGTGRQRLDSTHVISNIAVLTRLWLFVATVTRFLRDLRREHPARLAELEGGYAKRYLEREGYFADVKREQARRRLPVVATDIYRLIHAFEGDEVVCELESYGLLVRLFEEQCELVEGAEEQEPPSPSPVSVLGEGTERAEGTAGLRELEEPEGGVRELEELAEGATGADEPSVEESEILEELVQGKGEVTGAGESSEEQAGSSRGSEERPDRHRLCGGGYRSAGPGPGPESPRVPRCLGGAGRVRVRAPRCHLRGADTAVSP